jgi:hypothetical protein
VVKSNVIFTGLIVGLALLLNACVTTTPELRDVVVPNPDGELQTLSYRKSFGTWATYSTDFKDGSRFCAARGQQGGQTYLYTMHSDWSEHLLIEDPALPAGADDHQIVTLVIANDTDQPQHSIHGILRRAAGHRYLDLDLSPDPGAMLKIRTGTAVEISAPGLQLSLLLKPSQGARTEVRECALLSPSNIKTHQQVSERAQNPFSAERTVTSRNPFSASRSPAQDDQFQAYERKSSLSQADLRQYAKLAVEYFMPVYIVQRSDSIEYSNHPLPDGISPIAILTNTQGPVTHLSVYTQSPTPSIAWFQQFQQTLFAEFCGGDSQFDVAHKDDGRLTTTHHCTFPNGDKRIDFQTIAPRKGGGYWIITTYHAGLLYTVSGN